MWSYHTCFAIEDSKQLLGRKPDEIHHWCGIM